jgi:O-succinylbenzoate synthase
MAAGVALAAALPQLPYACGLATASLLAGDVTFDPMAPVEERLIVYRRKEGQRRDYLYLMRQEHA